MKTKFLLLLLLALAYPLVTFAGNTTTVTGTFLGVEQGDYAHWNMRTADGKEVSYYILTVEPSIKPILTEHPEKFDNRKCRVTIKKSVENIPEAGGKTEIEQILKVEWL